MIIHKHNNINNNNNKRNLKKQHDK